MLPAGIGMIHKYKAWDRKSQKLRNVTGLWFSGYEDSLMARDGVRSAHLIGGDGRRNGTNVDVLVYTNINDKDDLEIYEDYIVEYKGENYEISYEEASFIMVGETDSYDLGDIKPSNLSVVGTKYEGIYERLQQDN